MKVRLSRLKFSLLPAVNLYGDCYFCKWRGLLGRASAHSACGFIRFFDFGDPILRWWFYMVTNLLCTLVFSATFDTKKT